MPITPLPPAPQPTDTQLQFNEKAFDWVAALDTFTTQANALETNVDNLEGSTQVFAGQAANSASAAAASAATSSNNAATALSHASAAAANTNAPLWVSGTTYAVGALVYSAVTGRTYRRKIAGAGTTDPSADGTNWLPILLEVNTGLPAIRPSLLLDFANTKRLDPRITFNRTTTATYYDGKTVAKAEENLLIYSQQFDTGWVNRGSSETANAATAPDGTNTAYKLVENTADTFHSLEQNLSTVGCVASIYVKKAERSFCFIKGDQGLTSTTTATIIDLDNMVVTNSGSTIASVTIVDVGNDWRRIIFTTAGDNNRVQIGTALDGTTLSYTGDGTSGIYIWGAQLEQRSSVTAYTPTTTQPITNYIPVLQTAAAGQARFDHNPVTGESLGLLIEEQRTNLLLYSEQFDNAAAWATAGRLTVSANTTEITDPLGGNTAKKITETTDNGTHRVLQGSVPYANNTYTASVYFKKGTRRWVWVSARPFLSSGAYGTRLSQWYDLDNTAVGSRTEVQDGSTDVIDFVSASITDIGNNWKRCVLTYTVKNYSGSATENDLVFGLASADGTSSYAGATDQFGYIWGAQLEAGAFATSYIPTVAAQVTRAADVASMTSSNFSSWFSNAEGTLYTEINPRALAVSSGVQVNDNTTSNRIRLATTSVSDQGTVTTSGTAQATLDGGTPAANTNMKLAMSYKFNDFALSLNGGTAATDTSGTVPVVNQLQIGAETTTVGNLNIKKIAYYPKALSDAEKQALTTS
jgi:hypothetical protein